MKIENEIWKNVSEIGVVPDGNGKLIDLAYFENFWVSTIGRVYNSLTKKFLGENGKGIDKKGYIRISLSKKGKQINIDKHRLVAYAFIENPNGYPQINHKDENPSNNKVENLEWCTASENINYGTHNQRMIETRKTSKKWKEWHKRRVKILTNGKRSKKVYKYSLDNSLLDIYPSIGECERNSFDKGNISKCCLGKRKTAYGYKWSYEPPENKTTLRRCSFGALTLKSYDIKKVG